MGKAEKTRESWQERRKNIKHKWAVPFIYVEWRCEHLSEILEQWAFLDILGHAGRLSVLVAVVLYFAEIPKRKMQSRDQRTAKHLQAWQVINAAQGQRSSYGRIQALQSLNMDHASIVGLDLSNTYIPGLELEDARLSYSTLFDANLSNSNFSQSDLRGADLSDAILRYANFTGANLAGANLARAKLGGADLTGANLLGADLLSADLAGANLQRSYLRNIKNWQRIQSIELANIYGIRDPSQGFIEWATASDQGAVSIASIQEWQELIRKKIKEKKQQEAENRRWDLIEGR